MDHTTALDIASKNNGMLPYDALIQLNWNGKS